MCACVYSRLTEFDKVVVGGGWGQTADVEVGFAELLPSGRAAVAAAVVGAAIGARAGRSHWECGRSNRRLRMKKKSKTFKEQRNTPAF